MLEVLVFAAVLVLGKILWEHGNGIMNALLYRWSGHLPGRIIKANENGVQYPYLERYSVLRIGRFHLLLHRFLRDDPAPVHDHPWEFSASLIICGKYIEHRRWKKTTKRWLNWLTGDSFHRLEFYPGVYTWSLFFTTGTVKPWGMMEASREIPCRVEDQYASQYRGDYVMQWRPYAYGQQGNNPLPTGWWKTAPKGRFLQRERRDYVRSK